MLGGGVRNVPYGDVVNSTNSSGPEVNVGQLLAATAEFEYNWIPRVVAIVDGYVILHNKNKCAHELPHVK